MSSNTPWRLEDSPPLGHQQYPEGLEWSDDLVSESLIDVLQRTVNLYPERNVIEFLGTEVTYARLGQEVERCARGLQDLGIARGDRVGILLGNAPYAVILFFAVLRAGGVVVNLNPLYSTRELDDLVEDSGAKLVVTLDLTQLTDKAIPMVEKGLVENVMICPVVSFLPRPTSWVYRILKHSEIAHLPDPPGCVRYDDVVRDDGPLEEHECNPMEDVAVLQYTGGTTGLPKAAMLTHANLVANAQQVGGWYGEMNSDGERILGMLPLFHVFAMTCVMNVAIASGSTMILMPQFELKKLLRTIHRSKPTMFPAVPTIYNAIINEPTVGKYDLSSIRYCISGGAPLPVEVHRQFEEISGCKLVEGYGLSETSPVVTCNPLLGGNRVGSVGVPVVQTRVELRSLEDRDQLAAPGERGEIALAGPQVMKGYWHRKEETADSLRDGWFFTGDVGVIDDDGFLFIVDRIKDMILVNGYNVYPRNIEEALYTHPSVAEVIVLGIPDEKRGEIPKAYIQTTDGAEIEIEGLRNFLAEHLSPIEMPREFEFRSELPKTAIGKPSKKDLRDEVQGQGA